jgi:hypothetical protein
MTAPPKDAEARGEAGLGKAKATADKGNHSAGGGSALPPAVENMKRYRVALWAADLALALNHLSGDEFHAYWRFRWHYLLAGCTGIVDDDAEISRRIGFRKWPALKARLHALGLLRSADGLLRDDDLETSINKQRGAKERASKRALIRWRVVKGGV